MLISTISKRDYTAQGTAHLLMAFICSISKIRNFTIIFRTMDIYTGINIIFKNPPNINIKFGFLPL